MCTSQTTSVLRHYQQKHKLSKSDALAATFLKKGMSLNELNELLDHSHKVTVAEQSFCPLYSRLFPVLDVSPNETIGESIDNYLNSVVRNDHSISKDRARTIQLALKHLSLVPRNEHVRSVNELFHLDAIEELEAAHRHDWSSKTRHLYMCTLATIIGRYRLAGFDTEDLLQSEKRCLLVNTEVTKVTIEKENAPPVTIDNRHYNKKIKRICSSKNMKLVEKEMNSSNFYDTRNALAATVFVLNPMKLSGMNNLLLKWFKDGNWNSRGLYEFTNKSMAEEVTNRSGCKFAIPVHVKEAVVAMIEKYHITNDEPLFGRVGRSQTLGEYIIKTMKKRYGFQVSNISTIRKFLQSTDEKIRK